MIDNKREDDLDEGDDDKDLDEEGNVNGEDEDVDEEREDEDCEDEEDYVPCIEPERAQAFKKTMRQLKTFHKEISLISAKKPDNPINEFKLGLINEALMKANFVLGEEFLPFPGFNIFDAATMPSASDVVLMLSHYVDGLDAFHDEYCVDDQWNVTGDEEGDEVVDDE